MKTALLVLATAMSAYASEPRQTPVPQPATPSFVRELQDLMKPKEMSACVLPGNSCSEYDMCCSNGELCDATTLRCP